MHGTLVLFKMETIALTGSVQCVFPCGLRGYHVYKEIWNPTVGEKMPCVFERNNPHDRYAIAVTKHLPGRLASVTVGHLPREISRFTRFLLMRGAEVYVTVKDAQHRRSPLVQGGLEIPISVTTLMEASPQNAQAIEKFKSLVEQNYKEPVNGKFDDCTSAIIEELEAEDDDDD